MVIAAVIGHLRLKVIRGEVEWDLAIIHQQYSITEIGTTDRQVEELLHALRIALLCFRLGRIGRAVGISDEVNDRMLESDILEMHTHLQNGNNAQSDDDAVGMHVWCLVWRFASMDGQTVSVKFQLPKIPVKSLQFNSAASRIFQGSDHLAAYQVLKAGTPQVPEDADNHRQQDNRNRKPNPEPGVRVPGFAFFGHSQ